MDKIYIAGLDEIPTRLSLRDDDELNLTVVVPPGYSGDIKLRLDIMRPDAKVDIAGLYLCPHSERVNVKTDVRHICGGSHSTQLFKGIVGGRAKVNFDGMIYVEKDAQKTEAYMENHTILLSKGASINTSPQLEIYADDVKCSHGASTGYLNEDEQFYMRSRGISEADAKRLQIISFISPVLSRLPEGTKNYVLAKLW